MQKQLDWRVVRGQIDDILARRTKALCQAAAAIICKDENLAYHHLEVAKKLGEEVEKLRKLPTCL